MIPTPNTSISHATLNPEHLIPCFAEVLEGLVTARNEGAQRLLEAARKVKESKDWYSDEAYEVRCELEDALGYFAPPGCYFGAHPGDGSDFGWWYDQEEE